MTIGEFADLDVIVSDPSADSKLHEILAVLYRPIVARKWRKNIVEKYDYDGFKHRTELFLDLPISMSKAISGFFLTFAVASLKTTEIYLKSTKKVQREMVKEARVMLRGGGTSLSSDWLTKILSKYQGLQNLELEKHLTSLPTEKNKLKNPSWSISKWLKNIIK
jgi:hypothetical protein